MKKISIMSLLLIATFVLTANVAHAYFSSTVHMTTDLFIGAAEDFVAAHISLERLTDKPIKALGLHKDEWSKTGSVDVVNGKNSVEAKILLRFDIHPNSSCKDATIFLETLHDSKNKKIFEGKIREPGHDDDHDDNKKETDHTTAAGIIISESLQPGESIQIRQKVKFTSEKGDSEKDISCEWDEKFEARTRRSTIDIGKIPGNTMTLVSSPRCRIEIEHDDEHKRRSVGSKIRMKWKSCKGVDIVSDDGEHEELEENIEETPDSDDFHEWTIPEKFRGKERFSIHVKERSEKSEITVVEELIELAEESTPSSDLLLVGEVL